MKPDDCCGKYGANPSPGTCDICRGLKPRKPPAVAVTVDNRPVHPIPADYDPAKHKDVGRCCS